MSCKTGMDNGMCWWRWCQDLLNFAVIRKHLQDITGLVFFFTELLAQPHIGELESFVLHCNTQNYKLFLGSVKPRQSGEKWCCCGIPEQLQEIVVVSLLFCFM